MKNEPFGLISWLKTAPQPGSKRYRMRLHALLSGHSLFTLGLALANPLEGVQIYQNVGDGVVVCNGGAVAQLWAFDTKVNGLAVNAFRGGPLFIDMLVGCIVSIDLITQFCTRAGSHSRDTTTLCPILVLDRTDLASDFWVA